ncbi:MAG: DNA repair protein RadC [Oscillospiraceae bacterium]|nr:DNA repair protein RadC [Oscillospiraceae bacterium]
MSIHEGHRQRLKDRFRREGLDNFDELYVLELLLFYCIPRKDTNPIAHRLLDQFGSLTAVLEASPEELEKVEGISEAASTFLSLIPQVGRYYQVCRTKQGKTLRDSNQCGNYLLPYFIGRDTENVFLLCLDAKCEVICCKKVGEGNVNSANIPIRRVVEMALSANATSVVLAHNHPSGLALPSADDIQTTLRVAAALEAVEIALADHIVVSGKDFVSMAQSQYFTPNM